MNRPDFMFDGLRRLRSVYRTYAGAGAAIDASVGDDVLGIAFRNRPYRTLVHTRAAFDAIVADNVHYFPSNKRLLFCYYNKSPRECKASIENPLD
jgi:hypothetical protein